jgi:hypothetical protein
MYYDTGSNTLFYWNGTAWVSGGSGGSSGAPTTVAARAYRGSNQSFSAGFNKVPVDTISFDTSGMAQAANGRIVPPVAGYYKIDGQIGDITPSGAEVIASVWVNGSERTRGSRATLPAGSSGNNPVATDVLLLNAGDYVELYVYVSVAATLNVGSGGINSHLSVALLSSLASTAAPVTAARAYRSAGFTLPAATWAKVPLDTISSDPGGRISLVSGRYTCPATGSYSVVGEAIASGTAGTNYQFSAAIYVNGVLRSGGASTNVADTGGYVRGNAADILSLNAGDYIELYAYCSAALSLAILTPVYNYLSVVMVGQAAATPSGTAVARGQRNAAVSFAAGNTKVPLDAMTYDSSGMVQLANGRIVCPVAGYYEVKGGVSFPAPTAGTQLGTSFYKNGAAVSTGTAVFIGATGGNAEFIEHSDVIQCNAGDYLELYGYSSAALSGGPGGSYLAVTLLTSLPGAVGPVTAARAYRNAALTLTASAWTKLPVDTISSDPGGCVSLASGRYVCPATGSYQVSGDVFVSATASGQSISAGILKNGTLVAQGATVMAPASGGIGSVVADVIQCNAGDYLEVGYYCAPTALPIATTPTMNYLSVVQVGNSFTFQQAGGDLVGNYPNPSLRKPPFVTFAAAGIFAAGWSDYGSGWSPAGYTLDAAGWVTLRGLIAKSTALTSSDTIAVLPAGFRPAGNELFACFSSDSAMGTQIMRVDVNSSGVINTTTAEAVPNYSTRSSVGYLSLSGIRFQQAN